MKEASWLRCGKRSGREERMRMRRFLQNAFIGVGHLWTALLAVPWQYECSISPLSNPFIFSSFWVCRCGNLTITKVKLWDFLQICCDHLIPHEYVRLGRCRVWEGFFLRSIWWLGVNTQHFAPMQHLCTLVLSNCNYGWIEVRQMGLSGEGGAWQKYASSRKRCAALNGA